jgi:sugar phosphate isomerase/epimerase
VELALTQDTRRLVDTPTLVDAARAAGFTALGVVSGRVDAAARACFDTADLRCHELLGLQVRDDAAAMLATAERLASDAATMAASWVVTTFEVALTADVQQLVARCAALFTEAGAGLAVEFSPLGPVASIDDGLAAVATAGSARAAIIIDAWNFCHGSDSWTALEQVPLDMVAHLQFADALAPIDGPTFEEAMHRRALPGQGVLELDRFAGILLDRGYDGVVSMQVLSDELRELPVDEYARRVHDAGARYWL